MTSGVTLKITRHDSQGTTLVPACFSAIEQTLAIIVSFMNINHNINCRTLIGCHVTLWCAVKMKFIIIQYMYSILVFVNYMIVIIIIINNIYFLMVLNALLQVLITLPSFYGTFTLLL